MQIPIWPVVCLCRMGATRFTEKTLIQKRNSKTRVRFVLDRFSIEIWVIVGHTKNSPKEICFGLHTYITEKYLI